MITRAIFASAFVVASVAAADAATITNGGLTSTAAAPFATLSSGDSTTITGWTVGGTVDAINGYWQSADGDGYSVDLNGGSQGSLSQLITGLVINATYEITFFLSGNPDGLPTNKLLNVAVGDEDYDFTYDIVANGTTLTNMQWMEETFRFTAGSTSELLTFASDVNQPCCYGPAIDAISMAQVPLPAGLPLLVIGLGGLAMFRRLRKH